MPPDAPLAAPAEGALAWTGRSDKRSYYRLFFAHVLALLATGIATVALALFAFDLVPDDSGAVLGAALALKMLAYVVAAPVAAALTERLPRRPLLIVLDLLRAFSLVLLPFVTAIWQVFGIVFVFALASATFTLVYQAVAPYLLGSAEDYTRSLARSRVASELETFGSPLIAGSLLILLSDRAVFAIAAAALLVSAGLVRSARVPPVRTAWDGASDARLRARIWATLWRGPRLFLATPDLRGLLALNAAVAAATAMVLVNTVVMVQGMQGLDERAVAVAFAAFGVGAILGATGLPRLLPARPERAVMLSGGALMSGGLLLGSLVQGYAAMLALWLVIGAGVALALTPANYLIRRIARPGDLQTLFAAQFSIANGLLMLAFSAAGWLGAGLGMTAAFLVLGAAAGGATGLAARLWPRPPSRAHACG